MKLTKKSFEKLAMEIRGIVDFSIRTKTMERVMQELAKTNDKFDRERFRMACTPGQKAVRSIPSAKESLPLGTSFQHLVHVDTSEWYPEQAEHYRGVYHFAAIHSVEYDGVKYTIDECREKHYYPKGHRYAGQLDYHTLNVGHVYHQFMGIEPKFGNFHGASIRNRGGQPDYTVNDFLSDFLFNVGPAKQVEAGTAYQCVMTYTVEPKDLVAFERSLNKMAKVLRAVKIELEKDQPPKPDEE